VTRELNRTRLSQLAQSLEMSATMAAAHSGDRMGCDSLQPISLAIGEPAEPPAQIIIEEVSRAARAGETRYGPAAGLPELRHLIAEDQRRKSGMQRSAEEVIVTAGGKPALADGLRCLIDPGDEVIVLAPYWPSFLQQVRLAGGIPRVVAPGPDLLPVPDRVAAACNERTRLLILNDPNNPTSRTLGKDLLSSLGRLAHEHDLWILADQVYGDLVLEGSHRSVLTVDPDLRSRTLLVESFSKRFAMTGYRLGCAIGPASVIQAMTRMATAQTTCANLLAQRAGIAALTMGTSWSETQRSRYLRRRDEMATGLQALGCELHMRPEAAFYLFFRPPHEDDDLRFTSELQASQNVLLTPGTAFGCPGHVRISYGAGDAVLAEALSRVETFISSRKRAESA
jgi:aspartate aminotransferase